MKTFMNLSKLQKFVALSQLFLCIMLVAVFFTQRAKQAEQAQIELNPKGELSVMVSPAEYSATLQQLFSEEAEVNRVVHPTLGYYTTDELYFGSGARYILPAEGQSAEEFEREFQILQANFEKVKAVREAASHRTIEIGHRNNQSHYYLDLRSLLPDSNFYAYGVLIAEDGRFIPVVHTGFYAYSNISGGWNDWGFKFQSDLVGESLVGTYTLRVALFKEADPTSLDQASITLDVSINFDTEGALTITGEDGLFEGWYFFVPDLHSN